MPLRPIKRTVYRLASVYERRASNILSLISMPRNPPFYTELRSMDASAFRARPLSPRDWKIGCCRPPVRPSRSPSCSLLPNQALSAFPHQAALCAAPIWASHRDTQSANRQGPTYAQLLALQPKRAGDAPCAKAFPLPICTNAAALPENQQLFIEQRATDLYALLPISPCGLDYTASLSTRP